MSTVFTKIINGEIPSYKIDENEEFYTFLDINPLQLGHILVVPKLEIDYIFDLPSTYLSSYLIYAQNISQALKKAIPCKRIGITVIGLEVPHAHLHLVPINEVGDMNFSNTKLSFTDEEMTEVMNKIKSFL